MVLRPNGIRIMDKTNESKILSHSQVFNRESFSSYLRVMVQLLLYSVTAIYRAYDVSIDRYKNRFRQWNSKTPGHPKVIIRMC